MAAATIKAWTYTNTGYPSCLALNTVPSPQSTPLQPTQILVRPHAAAVNPVDIQIMNLPIWNWPIPAAPFNAHKFVGKDIAGTVIAAGASSGYKEGDEIFGVGLWIVNGSLAEVVLGDVNHMALTKKPASWSWEQAAALALVWLTARTCIERVTDYVGEQKKVVVLGGSSATGMYSVHMAKQRGWNVLATCSGKNADFVRGMGADTVVDYTVEKVPDEVRKFAPGAIIDCVGGTDCLNLARRYVTIVGDKTTRSSVGGATIYLWNPQMLWRSWSGRLGLSSLVYDCINLDLRKDWLEEALSLPTDKIIIDSTYGFSQTMEAFERLNTGRARGKVIVKFGS